MAEVTYICRRCGVTFSAIPGEEEPPECPECEKNETEILEDSSVVVPPESQGS